MSSGISRTEAETAWVAGLLEGEGAFFRTPKTSTTGDTYYAYRIACNMCDGDVLARLQRLVGGKLSGPHSTGNPKHRPFFRWNLHKRLEVQSLLVAILPYMGERRTAKIQELLQAMHDYPARPLWRHGTRYGYERGCRCESCRATHAK